MPFAEQLTAINADYYRRMTHARTLPKWMLYTRNALIGSAQRQRRDALRKLGVRDW